MPLATLEDGDIFFELIGGSGSDGAANDKIPIVLLLPQSQGPKGRAELVASLAQHHQVIRYDQRGTGQSPPAARTTALSMPGLADEVLALIDSLAFEKVHLLCHSTGCGIGVAFTHAYPGRVSTLTLTTPWTHADTHLRTAQNLRISCAAALDPVSYARYNSALLFPPDFRRAHAAAFEKLALAAVDAPQQPDDISRRLNAILAFDARPFFTEINCPTLVITARDDQLMPPWFGDAAAKTIPNATLSNFEGGGHMLPETRTAEFAETVLEFLRNVDAR
jgi:aminoacrylate hydrolase